MSTKSQRCSFYVPKMLDIEETKSSILLRMKKTSKTSNILKLSKKARRQNIRNIRIEETETLKNMLSHSHLLRIIDV